MNKLVAMLLGIAKTLNPKEAGRIRLLREDTRSLPIRIKEILGRDGPSTSWQLADDLNANKETIGRTLRRLRDRGMVQRIGKMWALLTTEDSEAFWRHREIRKEVDKRKPAQNIRGPYKKVTYFIEAVGIGFVKIGRSYDGENRVRELQIGCPYPLKMLCAFEASGDKTEERLQKRFAKYHFRGEWFYASKEIRQFIEEINDEKKD